MNLAELVRDHPSSSRALFQDGSWYTWGDVRTLAAGMAHTLSSDGVRPGDRVGIAWPTSVDFVVGYLGVLACGAVAVPLNPNSPASELSGEIEAVGATVVLAGGAASESLSDPGVLGGATRVVVGSEVHDRGRQREVAELVVEERSDGDFAAFLFTSGTAGAARPAMLTHGNLVANLRQMLGVPEIYEASDLGLAAVPLFHVFGLNVALGLTLATGAALVLEERFDPEGSLELVRELGVTTVLGVPTMFAAWAELPGADPSAMAGVRRAIAGAAALPPDVAERFEARFGVPVWQGYGLTEASPAVSTSLGTGRNRPGSVGRPLPGVELELVDDVGEPVLDGDPGEIWVRGPNVFVGYYGDESATREVLSADGWLRTGDIGVIGDDGDLYIVDRKKDLVIVSGFNVFPAEIERVVSEVPGVSGAVVVGRPDPLTGEAVEAVVERQPGAEVTEEEIRAFCAARLARYKCPSRIRFVTELPRGLAGKALRRAVRQQADPRPQARASS